MMIVVDAGTSYKYGAYLSDKSDLTTIMAFEAFCVTAETTTGKKVHRIRTEWAYKSSAWGEYCQRLGITHEFTTPYSSAQNSLAERAIRTTIDNVHTLLHDSGLGHSYWAEAAAFSILTRNLIPSRQHPGHIPWNRSWVKDRVLSTFVCLGLSVGLRPRPLMVTPSLTLAAQNVGFLGMRRAVGIIRCRMLSRGRCLCLMM